MQEEYEDLIGNIHITCCILITHTTVLGDNFTSPAITNAPIHGLETYNSVLYHSRLVRYIIAWTVNMYSSTRTGSTYSVLELTW